MRTVKRRVIRHYSPPNRAFAACGARNIGELLTDKPSAVTCQACKHEHKRAARAWADAENALPRIAFGVQRKEPQW